MAEPTYYFDDCFYDVEALNNVFMISFYYPKQNKVIISYVCDDKNLLAYPNWKQDAIKEIQTVNTNFDGEIVFEPLSNDPKDVSNVKEFFKRLGVSTVKNGKYTDQNGNYTPLDRFENTAYWNDYYPVKVTDVYPQLRKNRIGQFKKIPAYDKNAPYQGRRFGYNSSNYDMTILALFTSLYQNALIKVEDPERYNCGVPMPLPTAKKMREYNDAMFSSLYIGNMKKILGPANSEASQIYRGWKDTGRYLDTSNFNEKRVALKKALAFLGEPMNESDQLNAHNATILNDKQMLALMAYNVSDVINLRTLHDQPLYQNNYTVKSLLLDLYPQLTYTNKKGTYHPYEKTDKDSIYRVRWDALRPDSTSASFVEKVIAPYHQLLDDPVVTFDYPLKNGKVIDVLDFTRDWLLDKLAFYRYHLSSFKALTKDQQSLIIASDIYQEFQRIYDFYAAIRGRNFNQCSRRYKDYYMRDDHYLDDKWLPYYTHHQDLIEKIKMGKRSTVDLFNAITMENKELTRLNQDSHRFLFYYHINTKGQTINDCFVKSSCFAKFSIGGIHGQEINIKAYQKDLDDYNEKVEIQRQMQAIDADATSFFKSRNVFDALLNGETKQVKVRPYLKTGAKKSYAEWREFEKPEIFSFAKNKGYELKDKYKYVSIGPAHHEDFTSYYPSLLIKLGVFKNDRMVDEEGRSLDPYKALLDQRVIEKHKAKDTSLTPEERTFATLKQLAMKLLLNSASGIADGKWETNITLNNKTIAMRIIGQLFAWRIGQAQSFANARVPSTNTDGLYTMDISKELNDKILEKEVSQLGIGIEPEELDLFVTKDSNNRLGAKRSQVSNYYNVVSDIVA